MICNADILSVVEKYHMLDNTKSVTVGVSGGADSVCLLNFFAQIRDEYGLIIKAVHVNHNIRGAEALRDENFVRELCRKLDVKLYVFSIDIPDIARKRAIGEEECGRDERYKCFRKMNTDKIAVAHTLSDSIETLIFNMIRGAGIKGARGIPPVRDNIIRPLIECTRSDIEGYCDKNALSYITDSSNLSDCYTRNKIRHNVIPVLKEINGAYDRNLLKFMENASQAESFIAECADKLLSESAVGAEYDIRLLQSAHDAVLKKAIAVLLCEKMKKSVEQKHIDLCCKVVKEGKGSVEISKDLFFYANYDMIGFHENDKNKYYAEPWSSAVNGNSCETPVGIFAFDRRNTEKSDRNCIDESLLTGELYFRNRREGDCFSDPVRKNTKSLKKLFNEKKIPPEKRDRIAILCCDDSIVWIDGFGTAAKYVPKRETESIIIIKRKG